MPIESDTWRLNLTHGTISKKKRHPHLQKPHSTASNRVPDGMIIVHTECRHVVHAECRHVVHAECRDVVHAECRHVVHDCSLAECQQATQRIHVNVPKPLRCEKKIRRDQKLSSWFQFNI